MKLQIHFQTGDLKINELLEGANADDIVAAMQKRVATDAGFLVGAVVRNMTALQFAREATRRYNAALKDDAPLPNTCAEFVEMSIQKKFATVVEAA